MEILIPTCGRGTWAEQKTLKFFGERATLVVDRPEDAPPDFDRFVVCPASGGIRGKRQWILDQYWNRGKFVVFDDDLAFHEQLRDGGPKKQRRLEPEDAHRVLTTIETLLDQYPLAGLTIPFMLQNRPFPIDVATSMIHVAAFNSSVSPGGFKPSYRVNVSEDHDLNFQFLARGIATACCTQFITTDKYNARGGFSTLRTQELIEQSVRDLVELWGSRYVGVINPITPRFQFKRIFKEAPLREVATQ